MTDTSKIVCEIAKSELSESFRQDDHFTVSRSGRLLTNSLTRMNQNIRFIEFHHFISSSDNLV